MKGNMHRRLIIAGLVLALALFAALAVFLRPPPPAGQFPARFSEAEKRQVVAAANSDAVRQTLRAVFGGRFTEAKRWLLNSRKQTVRAIGQQGEGVIWVHFGVDDPAATDGHSIWARYIMMQQDEIGRAHV